MSRKAGTSVGIMASDYIVKTTSYIYEHEKNK